MVATKVEESYCAICRCRGARRSVAVGHIGIGGSGGPVIGMSDLRSDADHHGVGRLRDGGNGWHGTNGSVSQDHVSPSVGSCGSLISIGGLRWVSIGDSTGQYLVRPILKACLVDGNQVGVELAGEAVGGRDVIRQCLRDIGIAGQRS
jgi:hypothetical protein